MQEKDLNLEFTHLFGELIRECKRRMDKNIPRKNLFMSCPPFLIEFLLKALKNNYGVTNLVIDDRFPDFHGVTFIPGYEMEMVFFNGMSVELREVIKINLHPESISPEPWYSAIVKQIRHLHVFQGDI